MSRNHGNHAFNCSYYPILICSVYQLNATRLNQVVKVSQLSHFLRYYLSLGR